LSARLYHAGHKPPWGGYHGALDSKAGVTVSPREARHGACGGSSDRPLRDHGPARCRRYGRDAALGRDVALKVLPPEVASDREYVARFAREARTLASLNHPNIGTIYGWESSTGGQALVLELVEGPTLRDRIVAGPLPLEEALGIARQIADALEAAHDQGIVHRDLKPANIKVRPDGRVKVLDFGLAKALEGDRPIAPGESTMTDVGTRTGIVVGTPAYMSPEHARGEAVTRKTDVWSFGVVLFEMLSGRHPFGRGSSTEVMAAVLRASPEWESLPAGTPPAVTRLLRRCLEKEPRSRIHDIGDARLEIEDAISGRSSSPSGSSAAAGGDASRGWSRGARIATAAALVIVGAAIAAAYLPGGRPSTAPPPMVRLSIVPPLGTRLQNVPAVSPDGTMVAFIAARQGAPGQLWIRALSSRDSRILTGTEGVTFPFWSPDSRRIGFFADGKLKRVDAPGDNPPIPICDAKSGRGGAWLDDGTIVFTPEPYGPLARVPESGGLPVAFTTVNTADGELDHRFPARVPGGYLLYLVYKASAKTSGVRLVTLNAPNRALKFYQGIPAAEYDDGFLLFVKDSQLVAQRVHLPDGELTGEVVQMGAVRTSERGGRYFWSSSPSGLVMPGPLDPPLGQFTWLGHDGRILGTVGQPDAYLGVELSPDGQHVVTLHQPGGRLSVLDTARGVPSSTGVAALHPVWSLDGSRLAYMVISDAPPAPSVVRMISAPWAGGGTNEALHKDTPLFLNPVGWTRDGTFVWLEGDNGGSEVNIWQMPAGDPAGSKPYLEGAGHNVEGRLSRDGQWIAYAGDQSGDFDIIVQRFPSQGQRYTASLHGGRFPRWSADGRELFYLSRDFTKLMAVSVTGDPPVFGTPHELFTVNLVPIPIDSLTYSSYQYDVDSKNSRFIVNRLISEPVQTLDVVLNWNRK
jgi:hypothetical protein